LQTAEFHSFSDTKPRNFHDGGTRQTLQLNLPAVPVTDIKVHCKDLVLSTMGRSFWILDDIIPLHQLTEEAAQAEKFLFEPRPGCRMPRAGYWGGQGVPEYPPQGILIYYYLANKLEQEMILKIMDERGNVIRNFSSRAEADSLPRLDEIENQLIQTQEGKVGARLRPKLVRQLKYIAGMISQADRKPGEDAYLRLNDIENELEQLIESFETLKESWNPDH
jgi:hypothetical protein